MGIKFYCPNGHKVNVKSFLAGKKGLCPKCGVRVDIPLQSVTTAPSANGDAAVVKEIFKIDLNGAVDVTNMDGTTAATHEVTKTLFLDVVKALVNAGFDPTQIPAKIEGVTLGEDITQGPDRLHTLWVANDNDFLATVPDPSGNLIPNPNQFFVFGFTDESLNGSEMVLQKVKGN